MLEVETKSLVGEIKSSVDLYISAIDTKLADLDAKKKEIEAMQARMAEFAEKANEKVLFNVGGKKFATTKSTLLKQETFFSGFLESGILPDEKGYYFIDRTPKYFGKVMSFLRDGHLDLHGKSQDQIKMIKKEFDFYLIDITLYIETALLTWKLGDAPPNVVLSSDRKKVIRDEGKIHDGENYLSSYSFGSTGWDNGTHFFKIQVDNAGGEFSMNIGVAKPSLINMPASSGRTDWSCPHRDTKDKFFYVYNTFPIKGNMADLQMFCPPTTVIELALHCDLGLLTIAFNAIGDETKKATVTIINVPKREMLYPCVQLLGLNNSAKFV